MEWSLTHELPTSLTVGVRSSTFWTLTGRILAMLNRSLSMIRSSNRLKAKPILVLIMTSRHFFTFPDAQYLSLLWSEDHPDDLGLTREREVKLVRTESR
jgi:hypothetical protein